MLVEEERGILVCWFREEVENFLETDQLLALRMCENCFLEYVSRESNHK